MDDTMGNQQATSHQLAWLAGIWDGEGSFCISKDNRDFLCGALQLTNSSVEMINEITKIFSSYGVVGHLWLEGLRPKKHKRCYHVKINRTENIIKMSKLMLPYLIAKKAHAELLIRFSESRLSRIKHANRDALGRIKGHRKEGYTEEESDLYEQLKQLNHTGQ